MKHVLPAVFALVPFVLMACGADGPKPVLELEDGYVVGTDGLAGGGGEASSGDGPTIPGDSTAVDSSSPEDESTGPGPDSACVPSCAGKQCGSDGCGGKCGSCADGVECVKNACVPSCEHPTCGLGKMCLDALNQAALCGGTLDFDHDLAGNNLAIEVNVESLYGAAGVLLATVEADSFVATNPYEVQSPSGHNSCASYDQWNQYWLDDIIIRFVLPDAGDWVQGATHYVSLYIAQTIPGGIRVDFFAPDSPPGLPGSEPFQQKYTEEKGTAFVELMSPKPIGYVKVLKAQDPDFTIDDLSFGPITAF